MKKKLLSLVIAFVFTMGISVPAFAASPVIPEEYLSAGETGFSYEHSLWRIKRFPVILL